MNTIFKRTKILATLGPATDTPEKIAALSEEKKQNISTLSTVASGLAGGVAGALFYALLAGFSVPTQRSVLMLASFAWAWWRGSSGSGGSGGWPLT